MNEKVANKYFFKPHFWSSCWNVHLFYQSFKPCSVSIKEGFTKPILWKSLSRVSKENNLITCETFLIKTAYLKAVSVLLLYFTVIGWTTLIAALILISRSIKVDRMQWKIFNFTGSNISWTPAVFQDDDPGPPSWYSSPSVCTISSLRVGSLAEGELSGGLRWK